MSTGDLNGNLQRLLRDLKAIKCPAEIDEVGLRLGDPVAFLPLLNFILLKFSRHVARFIVRHGFELAGKTDQRFVESCFKLFRDVLNVRTVLTQAQYFEQGFAERKVLLLCDVIAVCKKLHNEEVRQERLAALKATRQDQVSSRLAAPRRTSPQVKVVRNDDIEIHQVLAPQHLPNASDGSQSVYKTKRLVKTSRSPSPSPAGLSGASKEVARPHSSPNAPPSTSKGESLELTFRPAAPPNAVPRQAPPSSAAAPPPIHTWFMNPAFAEGDEGVGDLRLGAGTGLGVTGRPDSSAWWRPGPSSPEQQAAPSWQGLSAFPSGAAAQAGAPAGSLAAAGGRQLFFGQQSAVTSTTAAPRSNLHQTGGPPQLLPQQQPSRQGKPQERGTSIQRGPHSVAEAPQPQVATIAAGVPLPAGATAGASRTAPLRDLDEWSFSKFFGPGKAVQSQRRGPGGGDDTDDSSHHDVDVDNGDAVEHQDGVDDVAWRVDDLEHDRPAADQDRRAATGRLPASRPSARQPVATVRPTTAPSPSRQRQPQAAATVFPAAGTSGSGSKDTAAAEEVDLPGKLAALEQETREQLQQLQDKLASAEQELEKTRLEARQSREALQARVTVLEGRVRFLECELELCVKRAPGVERSPAGSSAQPSPRETGPPTTEPSLAWNSTDRLYSAGDIVQPSAAAPPLPSSSVASTGQPGRPSERVPAATGDSSIGAIPNGLRDQGTSLGPRQGQDNSRWTATARTGSTESGTAFTERLQSREAMPWPAAGSSGTSFQRDAQATAVATVPGLGAAAERASMQSHRGIPRELPPQAGAAVSGQGSGPDSQHNMGGLPAAASGASEAPSFPGNAGTGFRWQPGFSPMPQPSFSFQPSSLMQQVASARGAVAPAAPPPSQHHHPSQQQHLSRPWDSAAAHANVAPAYAGSQSLRAQMDNASGSGTFAAGSGHVHSGGYDHGVGAHTSSVQPGVGNASAASLTSASNDAELRRPADSNRGEGGIAASAIAPPARDLVGGSSSDGQSAAAWPGPERFAAAARAGGRGSILDRAVTLDGERHPDDHVSLVSARANLGPASLTHTQPHCHAESPVSAAANRRPYPSSHAPSDTSGVTGAEAVPQPTVPSGGGPGRGNTLNSAAPAPETACGTSGSRSTEDVINSLYMRYTEAQDFLQTLRKR